MADPKGEWLGAGFLELKESKLWWKEDFDFPQGENITATLEHAVRHDGSEEGIKRFGRNCWGWTFHRKNKE